MVTGPSLISATSIIAPNSPSATIYPLNSRQDNYLGLYQLDIQISFLQQMNYTFPLQQRVPLRYGNRAYFLSDLEMNSFNFQCTLKETTECKLAH